MDKLVSIGAAAAVLIVAVIVIVLISRKRGKKFDKGTQKAMTNAFEEDIDSAATLFSVNRSRQKECGVPQLNLIDEKDGGICYSAAIDGELTIGRKSVCDIVIHNDRAVSSQHCRVFRENERFMVEDNQSSNGTYLNEVRIEKPVAIETGDILEIGRTRLIVRISEQTNEE